MEGRGGAAGGSAVALDRPGERIMAEKRGMIEGLSQAVAEGFERIKERSLRLARLGRLNLDLLAARGRLRKVYAELGQLAAARWLEAGSTLLDRNDPDVAPVVGRIAEARDEVRRLEGACRDLRSQAAPARPPGRREEAARAGEEGGGP